MRRRSIPADREGIYAVVVFPRPVSHFQTPPIAAKPPSTITFQNAGAAGHERGQPVLGDLVRALDELLVALDRLEADAADQVRHERAIALEGRAVP